MSESVPSPLTPEQSKAQVLDAAREVVRALDLPVVHAYFWRASCNDQGDPPFRGAIRIGYPLAPDREAARVEADQMAAQLQAGGWTSDDEFRSHSTVLKKNGVDLRLGGQAVGDTVQSIFLDGECRDVTTTKDTKGEVEDVSLP